MHHIYLFFHRDKIISNRMRRSLLKLLVSLALLHWFEHACASGKCSNPGYNFHKDDGLKNRVLDSRIFATSAISSLSECFMHCIMDCRCLSFNICDKQCQLNADTREMAANKIKTKNGCSHYDLVHRKGALSVPSCCLMSNPCFNNGACSPTIKSEPRRYTCVCQPGYFGDLCETKNPKSCLDYLASESVKPLSGSRHIVDSDGDPFEVNCDFDSEDGFAWTLVLSFSRENADSVQAKGLLDDNPVNEDGLNWNKFRLSLSQINTIREQSTHWRATCGYDVMPSEVHQEYMKVNLSNVDFSAYSYDPNNPHTACQEIEYMNILGSECRRCNFALYYHTHSLPTFILEYSRTWNNCAFDLSGKQHTCNTGGKAAFFFVEECFDPRSMCQKAASATTQNWFGAKKSSSD